MTPDLQNAIAVSYKDDFRRLYFCAYQICRNLPDAADAARDIVTDAYVKACKGLHRGDEGATLYTFLYRTVAHASIDHIRRHENSRRIRSKLAGDAPAVERVESKWQASDVTPRPFTCPERAFMSKERRELVRDALALHCNPRQVMAWELCKLDGLTTTAAAEMMDVSQPTAHRALNAALVAIRGHVAEMTC